ncbi:MAG: L,D-transpeptidase family protein [Parcubacteria group bacterium]
MGGLLVLGGGAATVATIYKGNQPLKRQVAQMVITAESPEQLSSSIEKKLTAYATQSLVFVLPDGKQAQLSLGELGIKFDIPATLAAAQEHKTVEPTLIIDEATLEAQLVRLTQVLNRSAQNAELGIWDGQVILKPEQTGQTVDLPQLVQATLTHVQALDNSPLIVTPAVVPAGITATELEPIRRQLETFLASGLSILTPNYTYEVSAGELGSWIEVSSSGYSFKDEMLHKKIRGIAREQDQKALPTKVIGNTSEVVEPGQPGIVVDQEATYTVLKEALLAGLPTRTVSAATKVTEPGTVAVASNAAPSSSNSKVIRIVLSEQRLYAWENGRLVKSFLVSTGLTGPTPLGNWRIFDKTLVQTYIGPGYYLPNVYYNSWFYPEIAIHQAYWHNNFGHPMSHGCVNARLEDAQFIYEWAPFGTPVEVVP